MLENILFYIVFMSQIIIISYYYPSKIISRLRKVISTYPQEKYPKLYPKPKEYYTKFQFRYLVTNTTIMIIGFIILLAIIYHNYTYGGYAEESIPVFYFMVQTFPFILLEISGYASLKLMRNSDLRTTRKANLQPRRLSDYVSPYMVGLAIFSNITCILFFLYINDFQFFIGSDVFIILIALLASNTLYAGIIYFNLYGKKQDPFLDDKDRTTQLNVIIKSLVFMSIIAGFFLMITKGIDHYELDFLEPITMSLYLQFILIIGIGAMVRKLKIENMNFDVYKVDSNSEGNEQNDFRVSEEKISYRDTIIGLSLGSLLGLLLGILILLEGGTINGFLLPAFGGIILGTIIGSGFDLRRFNK